VTAIWEKGEEASTGKPDPYEKGKGPSSRHLTMNTALGRGGGKIRTTNVR